jgi:hypothetical protein
MNHSQVIFGASFPARDQAAEVLQPGEEPLHAPTTARPSQAAAILRGFPATIVPMGSDQLCVVVRAQTAGQFRAVIGLVADQSLGRRREETLLEGSFDEPALMRSSAGHVHGERKTMAVCDRHDVAAFSAAIIAHSRAPFLALLKLPSMNASDRSSLPRSRKSSATCCRMRRSWPLRCHCWKRRWQV